MLKDKITVYIACWSGTNKDILEETVESIRAQGLEPIVEYDERYPNVRWAEYLAACPTPYAHIAHHDDVYLPGFYKKMVGFLEAHPTSSIVFCNDIHIDEKGNRVGQSVLPFIERRELYDFEFIINNMIKYGNFLRCPSACYNVKNVKGLKFPDECKTAGDTGAWFLALDTMGPFGIIDEPLYRYRMWPQSDTQLNVLGQDAYSNHWVALRMALRLRPYCLEWDTRIKHGQQDEIFHHQKERAYVLGKEKKEGCTFVVVHEPPDNAGTGILAAHRVREGNRGDDSSIKYYVCPSPEGDAKTFIRGVPTLICHPNGFQNLVDKYKPTVIEYHHLLRWPIEILDVKTDARKEFWAHDAHTICEKWHLFDGEDKCDGPNPEKCEDCSGVSANQIQEKNTYLRSALRKMDQVIANSEYTKTFLAEYLGVDAIVIEPIPPPLPHYRKRKVFGYFGGWYPVKGFHILLKAMEKVKWGQLLMFSDAPKEVLDGHKLLGYDNVLVLGSYRRGTLPYLLNLVDFVVVPSLNESYGLVKREAEMLGVRCIATDAGGLGGKVKAGDADSLAAAIQEEIDK